MTASAIAAAAAGAALLAVAPAAPPLEEVIARTARWVQQFEQDFATVIVEETYDQFVFRVAGSGLRAGDAGRAHRQIHARSDIEGLTLTVKGGTSEQGEGDYREPLPGHIHLYVAAAKGLTSSAVVVPSR